MLPRQLPLLCLLWTVAIGVNAQGGERTLTNGPEHNTQVQISPDGKWVAFLRVNGLYGIPFQGGTPGLVASTTTMSRFYFWTHDSNALLYLDGTEVRRVARDASNNSKIADIPGAQRLWAINRAGTKLYGVRLDTTSRQNVVFEVPTAGGAHTDLQSSLLTIEDLRIDATDSWLLHRETFIGSWQFYRSTIQGTQTTPFRRCPNPPPTDCPFDRLTQAGQWLGPGDDIVFYHVDAVNPKGIQLARMDFQTGTVRFLTVPVGNCFDPIPSRDVQWLFFERDDGSGSTRTVQLLPAQGGGEITLSSQLKQPGPVSISADGQRIAYGGVVGTDSSQVRVNEVDRELHIAPRVEVGKSFTYTVPGDAGETVLAWMSLRAGTGPLPVPPLTGTFQLDATLLLLMAAGAGTQTVPLSVPADPSLKGGNLYFQALRITQFFPVAGGFSRLAKAPVF
jgi:hypothetical protein